MKGVFYYLIYRQNDMQTKTITSRYLHIVTENVIGYCAVACNLLLDIFEDAVTSFLVIKIYLGRYALLSYTKFYYNFQT